MTADLRLPRARSQARPLASSRFRFAHVVAPILLASLGALPASAQSDPIYPTYEGWAPNPDGSYTLVFGYYSGNSVAVEIPPGPDNGFAPGPADRGQPVRFLPGRQRNVCRIVVDASFEGNLQWTLAFAGAEHATTEHGGVDPLYPLEEIGSGYRAARDLDPATVPRGRCVNRAPTVSAGRPLEATSGTATELSGFAADDGLPRGGVLVVEWRQLDGPAEAQIAQSSEARTQATFPAEGEYRLELWASDSEEEGRAEVTVTVKAP